LPARLAFVKQSLKVYMGEYKPKIAVRTSLCNIAEFSAASVLREIPLYVMGSFERMVGG